MGVHPPQTAPLSGDLVAVPVQPVPGQLKKQADQLLQQPAAARVEDDDRRNMLQEVTAKTYKTLKKIKKKSSRNPVRFSRTSSLRLIFTCRVRGNETKSRESLQPLQEQTRGTKRPRQDDRNP